MVLTSINIPGTPLSPFQSRRRRRTVIVSAPIRERGIKYPFLLLALPQATQMKNGSEDRRRTAAEAEEKRDPLSFSLEDASGEKEALKRNPSGLVWGT